MTPNLARLFEYKQLLGIQSQLRECASYFKRKELFERHGEALIEALDSILAADERGQGLPYAEAMQRAATLLARLESEAQP